MQRCQRRGEQVALFFFSADLTYALRQCWWHPASGYVHTVTSLVRVSCGGAYLGEFEPEVDDIYNCQSDENEVVSYPMVTIAVGVS